MDDHHDAELLGGEIGVVGCEGGNCPAVRAVAENAEDGVLLVGSKRRNVRASRSRPELPGQPGRSTRLSHDSVEVVRHVGGHGPKIGQEPQFLGSSQLRSVPFRGAVTTGGAVVTSNGDSSR